MKTAILLVTLLLTTGLVRAQDYQISFDGTGESTIVDSIEVANLTQGKKLVITGSDVLNLKGTLGINAMVTDNESRMKLYPNPIVAVGFIELTTIVPGKFLVEIDDFTGRIMAQLQITLQKGIHSFQINGLNRGIYILRVKSENCSLTERFVCSAQSIEMRSINYLAGTSGRNDGLMTNHLSSLVEMQYNEGDQLLFSGYSGVLKTIIPLVPTQSQNVSFNFVGCTDANGNQYATVTIGTQVWMAANLNVGVRINGSSNQTDNGIIEKFCYNDIDSNCNLYGALYQWGELMQYDTVEGIRGICPVGWHLPTNAEWSGLVNFLGGELVAGGKMKETGHEHWASPNTAASNSSGFSLLPGGFRFVEGFFGHISEMTSLWSSTQSGDLYASNGEVSSLGGDVYFWNCGKMFGHSGRCIKD